MDNLEEIKEQDNESDLETLCFEVPGAKTDKNKLTNKNRRRQKCTQNLYMKVIRYNAKNQTFQPGQTLMINEKGFDGKGFCKEQGYTIFGRTGLEENNKDIRIHKKDGCTSREQLKIYYEGGTYWARDMST